MHFLPTNNKKVQMKIVFKITILLMFPFILVGQPGSLDNTFGTGGIVKTPFAGGAQAFSVALQSDGKIVVGGNAVNAAGTDIDFGIARYNTNGSLDNSFNTTGKLTTDITGSSDLFFSVAIQPDGKILGLGYSWNGSSQQDFSLVRYNSNGTLDLTFDSDGIVLTDIASNSPYYGYAMTLQPDGKILVCGTTIISSNYNMVAVRYNSNGTLDPSFGVGGKSICDLGGYDEAWAIALQSDGKILLGGKSFVAAGTDNDFALVRLDSNGVFDPTFNSTGIVFTALSSMTDWILSLAIQPDGKIIAGGQSGGSGASGAYATVRYNMDGTLDSTYNSIGIVQTSFAGYTASEGYAIELQADGKIVMGGFLKYPEDFGIVRYNTNGSLNNSFGTLGKVITSPLGAGELRDIAIQSDGKILAVGRSDDNFVVVRYLYSGENGVEDIVDINSMLSVYPNPVKDKITLSYLISETTPVVLSIYDVMGIKQDEIDLGLSTSGNHSFEVSTEVWSKGIYMVELKTKSGKSIKRIVHL